MSHVTLVFLQMSIKAMNINILLITNFYYYNCVVNYILIEI